MAPLVPSFHVTLPPQFETLNVAPLPEQIVALFTLGVGFELTVTVPVAVPKQVPTEQVAVYEVVILGYTVRVTPLVPSFHVTLPPQFETLNVAPLPEQIVALFTLGEGFTQPQLGGAIKVVDEVQRFTPLVLKVAVIVCEAPFATKPIALLML